MQILQTHKPSIIKHKMDEALLEFDENQKNKEDVDKVKHEVRMLKRKHEALKEREASLVRDIGEGLLALKRLSFEAVDGRCVLGAHLLED